MLRINTPYRPEGEGAGVGVDEMVAQESMRVGNEEDGNNPPATNPFGMEEGGVQTASAFGKFTDFVSKGVKAVENAVGTPAGGITDPRTQDMVKNVRDRTKDNALDDETIDAVSASLDDAVESPPAAVEGGPETLETKNQQTIDAVDIDPAAVQKRFEEDGAPADKRTDTRNLNTDRHMEGAAADPIKGIEGIDPDQDAQKVADDVAAVFDAVANEIGDEHVVRKNKTLEEMSLADVKKEMSAYLTKDNKQLATDRQLYAARSVLNTMGVDVADLANKIKAGNATPEMLLNYQKKVRTLAAVQNHLRGNVREVARALQQQSVIAQTLKRGSIGDIDELMNVANMTPEMIKRHAIVMASRMEIEGPIAGANPTVVDRLNDATALAVEYWKASLLSGIETHMVNMAGNGLYNVWENVVIRPSAFLVGKGLQKTKWGSETDRAYAGETMGAIVSSYAGVRDGITMFAKMLLKDESLFMTQGKGESQGLMLQAANKVKNPIGGKIARGLAKTLSMPYRFLQAEDDFFKTLAYRQEVTTQSLRQAYNEGLTGKAAYERAAELIKMPSDSIHEGALTYAKNLTYTNTEQTGALGVIGKQMKKVVAALPLVGHLTPFINTPVNLMQRATDMSVLSWVNTRLWTEVKKGGAARDVAFAKMATGAAMTYAVYTLFEEGFITGNGPSNPDQRRVLEKTGWKPNSLRDLKTGTYYPYKRLEPFAGGIGGLVDKLEEAKYANREEDAAVYMYAAVFGIADHAMDGTFMKGLSDMFALRSGNKSPANFFAGIAASYSPMSSLQRSITKYNDPQMRRTSDDKEFQTGFSTQFKQRLKKQWPGTSMELRPARHWDGEIALPDQGAAAYAMSPVKISNDKGATLIDRELIQNGVPIKEPSPMMTVGRGPSAIHFSLVDLDNGDGMVYDAYFKKAGRERKIQLAELIDNDEYLEQTQGPGGERNLMMRRAIMQADRKALIEFIEDDLNKMYNDDPEKFNSIAQEVGLDAEDFAEKMMDFAEIQKEIGSVPPQIEEQMSHVRIGRGKREQPLPVPTDKIKPDNDIGF